MQENIYTPEERAELTDKEYKRLGGLFKDLEDGKRKLIDKLLREAAFLAVMLDELRHIISRDGVTDTYRNGATQYGSKPSAAAQTYDKLLNTFSKTMAQLRKELPEEVNEETNELYAFCLGRPTLPPR